MAGVLGPGARRALHPIARGTLVAVLVVAAGIGLPWPTGTLAGPARVAAADPTPTPTPDPTPEPTPGATPDPTPSAAPDQTPEPTPVPEPTASDGPTPQPTPTPTVSPDPGPTASPSPESSASPTPTPSPQPTPTPGIVPGSVNRSSLQLEARYEVEVHLRIGARSLSADETIQVVNRSGAPIDRLELNTVLARIGSLQISSASVDDRPVTAAVSDQTILMPLGGILPDGAATTVRLSFQGSFSSGLDGSRWLFTSSGGVLAAYRWLPWVSQARRFDRPNHGDPFVTTSSPSVRLRVTTDRPTRIATSGRLVSRVGNVHVFAAENVRDISFVADPTFAITAGWAGSTRVLVYGHSSTRRRLLLAEAVRALDRIGRLVGPYPWPTFTVVETAGGYAMESAGAIWIPRGVQTYRFRYLVTHETAHQWFYGLVGNDQALDPFADEATADFVTRYVNRSFRSTGCPKVALDRSIYRYHACYYGVIYVDGANVLNSVRLKIGSSAFFRGLRAYVADHRFGFGSTAALIEHLDATTTRDLAHELLGRFPRLLGIR